MSVARPVSQPNQENQEKSKKRSPGSVSSNGHWTVLDESKQVKGDWIHSCGEDIMGKPVNLTIQDGYFPLSGSGQVRQETVPFCPKCENEPNGGFVTPNGYVIIN